MTKGLLIPKSMIAAMKNDAVAASIGSRPGTNNAMQSDDFISKDEVPVQLAKLQQYINERRQTDPGYALPRPSGWKLMLLILTIPDETTGGLIIIDDSKEAKSLASPQGVLLAMGQQAYTDPERFSVAGVLTPWHEVGDRISFVRYDASMFQLANGQRLGFLNDTQPVATIDKGWEIPC